MRRKTAVKDSILQCESSCTLPHTKFQDFSEKVSLAEFLYKEKLQLCLGPICFTLCCGNIKSNCQKNKLYLPVLSSVQKHREWSADSFREEERKKHHRFLLYCAVFETLFCLKTCNRQMEKKFPQYLSSSLQQHQLKTSQSSYTQCLCTTLRQSEYFSLYFS